MQTMHQHFEIYIYSNCILHPYGSSNYNTKACKHIKEKQHKHNKYVNVGEIFLLINTIENKCPSFINMSHHE
jgi:hypothetical protein